MPCSACLHLRKIRYFIFLAMISVNWACRTTPIQEGQDSKTLQQNTSGANDLSQNAQYFGPPLYSYSNGALVASDPLKGSANENIWKKYCTGDINSLYGTPLPNMSNSKMKKAAKILSEQDPHSFSLYWQIRRHYYVKDDEVPSGIQKTAIEFLSYLCGEFRDRATMVEAKVNWILNTNYMPNEPQPQIDPSKNVWMQMTAQSYTPFIRFTDRLWSAKQNALPSDKYTFGPWANIDRPVPAQTVCETKYILSEFIDEGRDWNSLSGGLTEFMEGYGEFKNNDCTQEDLDFYHDFRGDGNFKPNSPESNGMIWYTISVASQCRYKDKAHDTPKKTARTFSFSCYLMKIVPTILNPHFTRAMQRLELA